MKKITFLLTGLFLFVGIATINAQTNNKDCAIKYNLFKGDFLSKKYDDAYPNLIWLLDNCPDLSINIYKYGDKLAKKRYETATDKSEAIALFKRIYEQRLKYYPNKNVAKAHSDCATFMAKHKIVSDEEVFSLLEKAYKIDPTQMGVKNIFKYFKGVTEKNKDTNPQLVFDTYDDVLESVEKKLDYYAKKIAPLNKKINDSIELDVSEKKKLRIYSINSKALGSVGANLDAIIIKLSTCDRLIPLYKRDYQSKLNDAKWLRRSVSRLYNKDCTDDPLYETLVEALVKADPSPENLVFFAGILYKKGKVSEAMNYYQQAVDQEENPLKKAKSLLKIAKLFSKKGQKSKARSYANKALKYNPNLGDAYLVISRLYASSANSCGSDEFEKRMVYVAATNKAKRAAAVDPSISSKASRYIKNYKHNSPDKKLIFLKGVKEGSLYSIKCWIGETVRVPVH